jgi:hypothetical protein
MAHTKGKNQTAIDHIDASTTGSVKIVLNTPPEGNRPKVHLVHNVDYREAEALASKAVSFKWIPHSAMSVDEIEMSLTGCSSSDCLSEDYECPPGCGCLNGCCY